MKNIRLGILAVFIIATLLACDDNSPVVHNTESPLRLSDWNLLHLTDNQLVPNRYSLRIQPLNILFSDYAHKLRTLWIPPGQQIGIVDGEFDYPVGTVLSKTFYYPMDSEGVLYKSADAGALAAIPLEEYRLLETRLLVRQAQGWVGYPYVWNDEQSEAFLRVAGASLPISLEMDKEFEQFTYFVPNENQCAGCHTRVFPDGGLEPLGAVASQLDHGFESVNGSSANFLDAMRARGWLENLPEPDTVVSWQDNSQSIEQRALAYLDMNCGHCHNPNGPADTSALLLDTVSGDATRTPQEMGLCKPPVAAGGGAGDRLFAIVPGRPDESIILYRMQSTAPDEMMPELGRSTVHQEGVNLIRSWIDQMAGNCIQ